MNPLTQSTNTTMLPVLIALTLTCFGVSPTARAVDPPPDGGYANGNTAEGNDALFSLTDGADNTAVGHTALYNNTTGGGNTANGFSALQKNSTGNSNSAFGELTLHDNTTGSANIAIGAQSWEQNTTGYGNSATGSLALFSNTTGSDNTAVGLSALALNQTGSDNTALGDGALNVNSTGENNIAVGRFAGFRLTTGNNNIDIGNHGVAGESSTIRLGSKTHKNTYIGGINGVTIAGGVGVVIDSHGHLGTSTSSAQYKEAIKPMEKASEAILSLQPVTFHYKHDLDPAGIPQFGLVAEQVEKVNPHLVARDEQGKPYTVRYEAINAMLLNEFLKEHRKVEEQSSQIAKQDCKVQKLEATVVQLQSALKEQAAQIRKVSDQLSATEPAARLVTNQ
jgi:trimeric autotransporter adhesin